MPEFKNNSADFSAFTQPEIKEEKIEEAPVEEEKTEPAEEPTHVDEVEDISAKTAKPVINDDDIPPFLRKLRK